MTRLTERLAKLEARTATDEGQLIIIRHTIAEDGSPALGRVVSLPDGAPTIDAVAALARLQAEGYPVPYGIEGTS